jgi:hypothetical protein
VFRKFQNLCNFGIFGICWFIAVIATGKDLSPCSASRTSSASTTGPAGCGTCRLYTCSPAVSKWLRHYPEQNSSTQVGRWSSGVTCLLGRATGQPTTFSSREASGESIRKNRDWPNDQMGDAGAASRWKGARRHQPEFGSGGQRRTSSMGPPYCWGLSSAERTSGQVTGGACSKRISAVSLAWSSAANPRLGCQPLSRTSAS